MSHYWILLVICLIFAAQCGPGERLTKKELKALDKVCQTDLQIFPFNETHTWLNTLTWQIDTEPKDSFYLVKSQFKSRPPMVYFPYYERYGPERKTGPRVEEIPHENPDYLVPICQFSRLNQVFFSQKNACKHAGLEIN